MVSSNMVSSPERLSSITSSSSSSTLHSVTVTLTLSPVSHASPLSDSFEESFSSSSVAFLGASAVKDSRFVSFFGGASLVETFSTAVVVVDGVFVVMWLDDDVSIATQLDGVFVETKLDGVSMGTWLGGLSMATWLGTVEVLTCGVSLFLVLAFPGDGTVF